jgi:hypothetical protein
VSLVTALFASTSARADESAPTPASTVQVPPPPPADPPADQPKLHHAPRSAVHVGEDVEVGAVIDRPDRVKRALLVYRGQTGSGEVEFQRSSNTTLPYVALVPQAALKPPWLAYSIEIDTTDGKRVPVFASREAPHAVTVLDSPQDAREAVQLARLQGRRSVVKTSGEFVDFGKTSVDRPVLAGDGSVIGTVPSRVKDQYYRLEAGFTYRLLGIVSEFGLRGGIVRGQSPVPGGPNPANYDVGLNYGAPRIRLRAADFLHFDAELLTSVTEVGFSSGGGGAIIIGDPYGSKFTFGMEGIEVFGIRGYSRLDVVANKRLTLAPIIEVSNMPHADRAGVRLLGEAAIALGYGFNATVRGGYQARSFDQGGPSFGGGASYEF